MDFSTKAFGGTTGLFLVAAVIWIYYREKNKGRS